MPHPVKTIAFYLPQYHPIPENDAWWGEGFTEWTNVRKSPPRFPGHYQPHVPGSLGYYDLRDPAVRRAQAELARRYGIHGFCYYHYWFNGKRLLETPFNEVLKTGDPDFPFCLCWANENWSRRWDGSDQELLMEQHYSDEDDLNFITDLLPAFKDERYIRVNGRPLLLVYRTGLMPDPGRTAGIWRKAMKEAGIGDLYLVRVENFMEGPEPDPATIGFDAAVEFAPYWNMTGPAVHHLNESGQITEIPEDVTARDYRDCMRRMLARPTPEYKLFRGLFPCWDNSPRRKTNPTVFIHSTPAQYGFWLAALCRHTTVRFQGDERLVFINAWNEWGEGCHLEPDQKYGLAHLEATRVVLAEFGMGDDLSGEDFDALFRGFVDLLHSLNPAPPGPLPETNVGQHHSPLPHLYLKILTELKQREVECRYVSERLAESARQLVALNEHLVEKNQILLQLDEKNNELAQLVSDTSNQIEMLQVQKVLLETQVGQLLDSYSWRITKPLRWVMEKVARITEGKREN